MARTRTAIITGAGGLVGRYLVRAAAHHARSWRVVGLTREALDLTDASAVRHAWAELEPDLVLHCAALSKPRHCQQDPRLARRLNVDVTARLAELARDARFVLLSTDQVFDGGRGSYDESAAVSPISVYAETKVEAERVVLANPRHTVVRTSLNAGLSATGDRAFNEEIRRAWEQQRALTLFTDEYRCPIPAEVTAQAVWALVQHHPPGLYHVAGTERLSRWRIGELLASHWPHLIARMAPGSIQDCPELPRQPDLSLCCAKAQACLPFRLPAFSRWLAAHPDAL